MHYILVCDAPSKWILGRVCVKCIFAHATLESSNKFRIKIESKCVLVLREKRATAVSAKHNTTDRFSISVMASKNKWITFESSGSWIDAHWKEITEHFYRTSSNHKYAQGHSVGGPQFNFLADYWITRTVARYSIATSGYLLFLFLSLFVAQNYLFSVFSVASGRRWHGIWISSYLMHFDGSVGVKRKQPLLHYNNEAGQVGLVLMDFGVVIARQWDIGNFLARINWY